MNKDDQANYIEFPSKDLNISKKFFSKVFNWSFRDFGEEYVSFANDDIRGGFYKSKLTSLVSNGCALLIFFSDDIEKTKSEVVKENGTISKDIFSFPGGKRFHFLDPNGNEYAVWSN